MIKGLLVNTRVDHLPGIWVTFPISREDLAKTMIELEYDEKIAKGASNVPFAEFQVDGYNITLDIDPFDPENKECREDMGCKFVSVSELNYVATDLDYAFKDERKKYQLKAIQAVLKLR